MNRFTGLILALLILLPITLFARLEIIKLNYAKPESVVGVIQKLFPGTVTVTAAPMINGIIVKTEMDRDYAAVERLIRSLDRKPAMLKFSIKRMGNDKTKIDTTEAKFGAKGGFNRQTSIIKSRSDEVRNITTMEFAKAALTDETLRVFTVPTWYGPESNVITTTRGLKISGHLASGNTVIVEVWYAHGDFDKSEALLTSLEVPIGTWFSIGGNTENRSSKTPVQGFQVGGDNKSINVSKTSNTGFIQHQYLIKVDMIQKQ